MSRRRLPVTPWGAGEGGRRGRRTSAGDRRGRRASAASGRVRAARSPWPLCPSVRPSVRQAGARPRAAPTPRPPPPARAPRLRTLTPPPGARPAAADWPAPQPRPRPPPRAPPRRPGRRPAPRSAGSASRAEGAAARVGAPPPPRGRLDSGSAGWSSLGIVGSPLRGAGGGRGWRGVGSPGARAPSHGDQHPADHPVGHVGRDESTPTLARPRTWRCPRAYPQGHRLSASPDAQSRRTGLANFAPSWRFVRPRAVKRNSGPTAPRGSGPRRRRPRRPRGEAHLRAGATGQCVPQGLDLTNGGISGRARVGPSSRVVCPRLCRASPASDLQSCCPRAAPCVPSRPRCP